jgi:hypothetical protein
MSLSTIVNFNKIYNFKKRLLEKILNETQFGQINKEIKGNIYP